MNNPKCRLTLQTLKDGAWTDTIHGCRTDKGLMKMLRRDIKRGEYHGYRLITVHEKSLGLSGFPNSDSATAVRISDSAKPARRSG